MQPVFTNITLAAEFYAENIPLPIFRWVCGSSIFKSGFDLFNALPIANN